MAICIELPVYALFFKRLIDFLLSFCAILCLLPILCLLSLLGFIFMKGNPFFTQLRPGKNERIFRLIKFRSMTCETDSNGNPLPDEQRLVPYGKFLRSTSLDELPELFNIMKGDMSIIGPRPLLVKYLPYYTDEEHHRHDVRPGLTGYAQAHGRNALTWEKRFEMDVQYVRNITFINDIKIIVDTVKTVFDKSNVQLNGLEDFDVYRQKQHC